MTRVQLLAAQRKASESAAEPASLSGPSRAPVARAATPEEQASFLVDDEATELRSGQMRKTPFLLQLRAELERASDRTLSRVGRSTEDCPFIESWFDRYRDKPAAYVEKALRRYAPETRNAASASEYIPVVATRVSSGVAAWAETGGVPELPDGMEGAELGLAGGVLGGLASGLAGLGQLLFKRREGAARPNDARVDLGAGRPLDPALRGRLEPLFGHDFSRVRVHTESGAADASDRLAARAFTVGDQIAFARDEYQPGTLVGDALIAHELAHVVQQSGAQPGPGARHLPFARGPMEEPSLEDEADNAAAGAVLEMWGGERRGSGLRELGRNIGPRVKTGLRLQRCATGRNKASPFGPERAIGQQTRKLEEKQRVDSLARFKANPGVYDPDFVPQVDFDFIEETYTYDFNWPSLELEKPCQGSLEASGCTTLQKGAGPPVVKPIIKAQSAGTTTIQSPLGVLIRALGIRVNLVVPRDALNEHTYNHELHHVVRTHRMLQDLKERLSRNVSRRLMERRREVARDPSKAQELLSAAAIEAMVAQEIEPFDKYLAEEFQLEAGPVDAADPATPPEIPSTFAKYKKPPLVKDTSGPLTQ